jgi:hypothetical protein
MRREYHVVLLNDLSLIIREIGTKNSVGLKSKLPLITDRLQPNLS